MLFKSNQLVLECSQIKTRKQVINEMQQRSSDSYMKILNISESFGLKADREFIATFLLP